MSKTVASVVAVALLAIGFAAGWSMGHAAAADKPPVRARTPEEVAVWIEKKGELRALLMERNLMARIARLSAWLDEAGPDSVSSVVTLLQTGAFGLGSPEAAVMTRYWATHDPSAAADWALKASAPLSVRPIVAETAIEAWATQDPTAARPLIENYVAQVAGAVGEAGMNAFVRGWFQSDEPGLEEFIRDLGPSAPRRRYLTVIVHETLYRDGFDATLAWLDELPDEDERFKRDAYRAAAPELIKANRERALAWCEEHCDRGYAEHSRALMAKQWAIEDGPAALEWVSTAPAGDERDRAVWATITNWRRNDPIGLSEWAYEVGPDWVEPWFYPAVDRIAMMLSWTDPLTAYRWAAHIPDDEKRENVLVAIAHRHREVDAPGADAWISQSPLSEAARQKASKLPDDYKGRSSMPKLPGFLDPS